MKARQFIRIKAFLFTGAVLILILITMVGHSHSREMGGKILQQMEKKQVVPQKIPPPVIKKKEESSTSVNNGKKILVRQIRIVGAPLIGESDIQEAINSVVHSSLGSGAMDNRRFSVHTLLSLSQLNQIAAAITSKYRAKDYLLAYAFIPPQEIKEGLLDIRIREGRVGAIRVAGNRSYRNLFIEKHLEGIKQDSSPQITRLERSLLLLNTFPSLNVKAQLTAGKEPGTTDIIVGVKDSPPISGSISYDNFGADTTSKSRATAAFNIGNLLTDGDYLTLAGVTGLDGFDLDALAYGRVEYLFPLDNNGSKLGGYFSRADYEAGGIYGPLNTHGDAKVAGLYATHSLITMMDKTLEVKFGFDYKDVNDSLLEDTWSKDRIRVFSLGATYAFADCLAGRNSINIACYQGVRGLFGGNGGHDDDVSRLDADGAFRKFTVDLAREQALFGSNFLMVSASGQFADETLFVSEQFMIGGAWGVRGYKPYSSIGDSGYLLSAEFHIPPPCPEIRVFNQKLGETVKLVLFADHGGVFKNNCQPGESRSDYQTAIGGGMRFLYRKYGLKLDWSVPRVGNNFNAGNGEVYLQATAGF